MSTDDLYVEIQHLLSRGDHRAAAIGYEELGDPGRARALYEGLFDYREAGRLAEMQGDFIGALGLYLKAGEVQSAEALRRALMADLSDDLPAALALFERRGYYLQAAELAESIGRLAAAADLYKQASSHKRAAGLLERLGRLREAGESYEKCLVGQPDDARANLGLGRILQRFGRHREALGALCRSVQHKEQAQESARRIAYAFFKLGFLEAGRTALELAGLSRSIDPDDYIRPFEDELQQGAEAPGGMEGRSASGALEGRYRLEKPLGGRIGATFMGRDLLGGKAVVLRFFPGSSAENAAFYDELERLQHARMRGLVRVFEINREGGFVVTDYVEGRSLLGVLQSDDPPNAMRCKGYALQVLDAITSAHQAGVLHGALSPSSVRLAPGGACLVDDWGVRHIEKRMATQTGGPESTFAYRAPELNIGRGSDFQADLFSVAAVLYRCLVGRAPLMGRGAEGFEDWPEGFAEFFDTALAANAEDRFPSHDLFRRSLLLLPWQPVGTRKVVPVAARKSSEDREAGPRFLPDREPGPGEIVTAHDTLLGRDVRLLRLPDKDKRPVQLVDRLTALAGPEVPVFQDVLRYEEEPEAIILELMQGEPVSGIVTRQGPIEPIVALEAGAPLLDALAAAHLEGIGLGFIDPDTILFDGEGLRAPIERSLLLNPARAADAIVADTAGYWAALLFVIEGRPNPDPGPIALVRVLRDKSCLLVQEVEPLIEQIPPAGGSLAPFPEWFDELRRSVDTCIVRRTIFDRLHRVVGSAGEVSEEAAGYLEERRKKLGIE